MADDVDFENGLIYIFLNQATSSLISDFGKIRMECLTHLLLARIKFGWNHRKIVWRLMDGPFKLGFKLIKFRSLYIFHSRFAFKILNII